MRGHQKAIDYHNLSNTFKCRQCNEAICFDDEHVSEKSGKKIPLDPRTNQPHNCSKQNLTCDACGKEIFFDSRHVSKTGKKIPLSKSSKRPHRCKEKPFNKDTRRQWWHEQQQKAEEARARRREEERKRQQQEEFRKKFWEEWEKERTGGQEYYRQKQQEEERKRREEQARRDAEERYRRERYQRQQQTIKNDEYYCKILGISIGATNKEITAAYRKLCMHYHPDRCTMNGINWEEANTRMAKINEAYENVLLTAE